MTPTQATYWKLPGTGRKLLRKATLWLSSDHILAVDSHRFTEEYKRYYFKDIQAIIVTQIAATTDRTIDLAVIIVLVFLALVAWRIESRGTAIVTGLLLIGYMIHKSLGPMCACHLITAVSSDKLPSLNRVRTAQKALRIIQPLVEQAQRGPAS
jgi:hypothetical protein